MASVVVHLPSLLAPFAGGRTAIPIEAETLRGALDTLVRAHPALAVHLFDESARFRQHVLCFHNQANTRWLDDLAVPVAQGDAITILQAVSGG